MARIDSCGKRQVFCFPGNIKNGFASFSYFAISFPHLGSYRISLFIFFFEKFCAPGRASSRIFLQLTPNLSRLNCSGIFSIRSDYGFSLLSIFRMNSSVSLLEGYNKLEVLLWEDRLFDPDIGDLAVIVG